MAPRSEQRSSRGRRTWLHAVLFVFGALLAGFAVYVSDCYHADQTARAALVSDEDVVIEETDFGWRFDGPATDAALVFYPGGKVEAEAYAPLLHLLAEEGMDACLVKMPFNLAVLDVDAASRVLGRYEYERWYVGGHSLGGAMAASFAADNPQMVEGLVLCAAYPTSALAEDLRELVVYGTRDQVLDGEKLEASRDLWPDGAVEHVIEGGNHAQFGSYGEQADDGTPTISAEEQRQETVDAILAALR